MTNQTHHLLLVSEDARRAEQLHGILGRHRGYAIAWSRGPDERECVARAYDLALLDGAFSNTRRMAGRVRGIASISKLLVLVPFGHASSEAEAFAAGADDVLMQPVSRFRLESSVRNLLRICELERALAHMDGVVRMPEEIPG